MSTASRFVAINYFSYCPQSVSVDVGNYTDVHYLGPFSLTEAMSFYWNLESATFSINGRSIAITGQAAGVAMPIPQNRVCEPGAWVGEQSWTDSESGYCQIVTEVGFNSPSYYIGVAAYYFAPTSQNGHLTTLSRDAPGPDWTAVATYSGTVLGLTTTWYRYWFVDYYPTYSGTDNASVGGSFYSY